MSYPLNPYKKKKTSASQSPSQQVQGHTTANNTRVRFNLHDEVQFVPPTIRNAFPKTSRRPNLPDDILGANFQMPTLDVFSPAQVTPNGETRANSPTVETTLPTNRNIFPETNMPRPPPPQQPNTATGFYSPSDLVIICNHSMHCICINCYCTGKTTCKCKVCCEKKQAPLNNQIQATGATTGISVPPDSLLQFRHYGPVPQTFIDSILCAARSTPLIQAQTHSRGVLSNAPHGFPLQNQADHLHNLMVANGLQGVYGQVNVYDIMSPVVALCLQTPIQTIGIGTLSLADDFAPFSKHSAMGRALNMNHHGNICFTPISLRDKKPCLFNLHNHLEIDGNGKYNPSFWTDQKVVRKSTQTRTGIFKSIEFGALVPTWLVPVSQLDGHNAAFSWMKQYGPACQAGSANVYYLSLKEEYCTVFERNMSSPLMKTAREANWLPLFLLKQCIVQKTTHFGINNFQISSVDTTPKSYLCLAAFYKGDGDDLKLITLTDAQSSFIVVGDTITA
jgi:hypothetical protein